MNESWFEIPVVESMKILWQNEACRSIKFTNAFFSLYQTSIWSFSKWTPSPNLSSSKCQCHSNTPHWKMSLKRSFHLKVKCLGELLRSNNYRMNLMDLSWTLLILSHSPPFSQTFNRYLTGGLGLDLRFCPCLSELIGNSKIQYRRVACFW